MIKKYSVTLEFEAEIAENVSLEQQEKFENFKEFLEEFLKNKQAINDIYKNLLIYDLSQNNNPFVINIKNFNSEVKDDYTIIKGVVESLKGKPKEKLLGLLERKDEKTNKFLDEVFDLLGELKLNGFIFSEKQKT
jgi:hypothetical protein